MKTVRVLVEIGKDGTYGAYMPDDNGLSYGVIGDGPTVDKAIADFKNVYEWVKEYSLTEGYQFEEVKFAFSIDVPSFIEYYANLFSYKGLSNITGISAAMLSQYANGTRIPSTKIVAKIQSALNSFGVELSRLRLV
jgi:transcriptional regulator with XRE-family HTH domain